MLEKVKIGQIFKEKNIRVEDRNIPSMSCTNLGIIKREEKFTKELSKSLRKNKVANKGDFVFGLSREILNFGMMQYDEGCFSSAYKIFECNMSLEFSKYLELYIRQNHNYFYQCISGGAREGQTISKDILLSLEVIVPKEDEIKKIIELYELIDEKIKINHQINLNLEEIMKNLFESWFINFEPLREKLDRRSKKFTNEVFKLFPSKIVKTNLGNIPEGWFYENLGDLFKIEYGKNLPVKKLLEDGYPVFGGNGIIGFNSKYLYEDAVTIIACRGAASGKVGRTTPRSFVTNNSLVINHVNSKIKSQKYVELFLKSKNIENYVTGSAQPQLTIENIKNLKFLVPPNDLLNVFEKKCKLISQRQLTLNDEMISIKMLKDKVLLKLISNDLNDNIDKKVQEIRT